MAKMRTKEEEDNFLNQLGDLVEIETFGSIVKKAWEQSMKQDVYETKVIMEDDSETTLGELLDRYDSGDYNGEMKEAISNVVNVPKVSRKLDRLTHGQFSAAVGKKLSNSMGKLRREHEKRLKAQREAEGEEEKIVIKDEISERRQSSTGNRQLEPARARPDSKPVEQRPHYYRRTGGFLISK